MEKQDSDDAVCCLNCGGDSQWIVPFTFGNIVISLLRLILFVAGAGALILNVLSTIIYCLAFILLLSVLSLVKKLYRTRLICQVCAAPIKDYQLRWTWWQLSKGPLNRLPCLRRVACHVKKPVIKRWVPGTTWKKLQIFHHQLLAGSFENHNEARAVRHLRQLEVLESERGLIELGFRYLTGKGVKENHARAYRCFEKAASQNGKSLMYAEFQLGCMHLEGHYVAMNSVKAGEYFEKAAQKGYVPAQYNWGLALIDGWAGYEDYAAGVEWIKKAAAAGDAEAQETLTRLKDVNP